MNAPVDVLAAERRCHCCGEPFACCRETYRGMTAPVDVLAAPLTELRIKWLAYLAAAHGETPWARMPTSDKAANRFTITKRPATHLTWRPMVDAGLITARFGQRNFREVPEWLFTITDAGRAALRAVGGDA